MSKTTKIIAALGVVAGLGVAALPAFTFATETVTGDVEVQVEVQPAIAMTISGNNDGATPEHTSAVNYVVKAVEEGASVEGLFTLDSTDGWVAASGTATTGTTYYEQVTITRQHVDNFAPAGIASTQTVTNTIDNHTIPQTAVLGTSSSYAELLPNSLFEGSGEAGNGFRSTITVYTNNNSGYTLTVKDKDTNTSLMHTTGKFDIPTQGSALAAGTAGWNFDSTPGEDSAYSAKTAQAMPASTGTAVEINQTSSKTRNGSATVVDYNVATAADQATGVYSDIIVYTATTNL
ncbi:hypothetical protein J6S39_01935 [Candidatus Saccharibacteria bacterium]|nr:hypothetical protein [Candidatus Saccharibacteria bacterium]